MAFETIPMNLTALQDITPPNISVANSFSSIVSGANSYTNDLLIFASMIIVLVVMYWALSDKSSFQDFGYDDMRALNIAFASSVLIGLTMIEVGWSTNFYAIGMFTTLFLITFIAILIYENKE